MLRYSAKLAADWMCLELLTHYLYFNSIAKHRIGMRLGPHGLHYAAPEMGGWCPVALGAPLPAIQLGLIH